MAAQTKTPAKPSKAFATESLNALTSLPTSAAAKWLELGQRRPAALLGAIAAAEKKGWKPTSSTARYSSQVTARRVALQDLWEGSGSGEMLVWDWEDGSDDTGEATIWMKAYASGTEVTFNIQMFGWHVSQTPYEISDVSSYEMVDQWVDSNYIMASLTGSLIPRLLRAQWGTEFGDYRGQPCDMYALETYYECLGGRMQDIVRNGLRDALFEAAVETGWRGRITGALRTVRRASGIGLASAVLQELILGSERDCKEVSRRKRDWCLSYRERCPNGKLGCGVN